MLRRRRCEDGGDNEEEGRTGDGSCGTELRCNRDDDDDRDDAWWVGVRTKTVVEGWYCDIRRNESTPWIILLSSSRSNNHGVSVATPVPRTAAVQFFWGRMRKEQGGDGWINE